LQAVSEAGLLPGEGQTVWLKGFGQIKVFRVIATNCRGGILGDELRRNERVETRKLCSRSMAHSDVPSRIKTVQCLIERAQCRRVRPVLNHIGLCIRAFVRLESHCYRERISWIEAKTSIIRDAVKAYLSNPRYLLIPTA
jgi:hypothetical protein